MSREALQSEIDEAEQELSALLERLINAPVKKTVKEHADSISFNLKQDFDKGITGVKSDARKNKEAFEETGERVSDIAHGVNRLEQAAGALEREVQQVHLQLTQTLSEQAVQALKAIAAMDERQGGLAKAQVQHSVNAINGLGNSIQQQHELQMNTIARVSSQLEKLASQVAQQMVSNDEAHKAAKTRFAIVCGLSGLSLLLIGAAVFKLFIG